MLTAFFGGCWIGVLTFHSDRLQRRIGFLSDRGVSITLTWLTRQAVPISVLCTVIIFCYSLFSWNDNPRFRNYADPFLIVSLVGLLLATYAVSQWVGQTFTSSISAAVASPPIAAATYFYLSFAWGALSAPIWLLVLCFVIPLLATWTTMRRWMDSRLDKVFWSTHSGFLLAFLFIPWVPMAATVLMLPSGMSREVADELAAEAKKHKSYEWTRNQARLSLVGPRSPTEADKLKPSETLASLRQKVLSALQQRVQATSGPLVIDPNTMGYIIAEAMLRSDQLLKRSKSEAVEKVGEDTDDADAVTNDAQQYRALLKLASDIVDRTRLCHSILQQDRCDTIEIWLLSELQRAKENPIAMKLIGDDLYATIAERLANSNDRNDARRRAVALSWQESQMTNGDPDAPEGYSAFTLGQYYLGRSYNFGRSLVDQAIGKQKVSSLASELWMLVKAGSRASGVTNTDRTLDNIPEAHWNRIASIAEVPVQFYGIGPRGEFLRADNANRFVFETSVSQRRAPASQWFADWERQAAALVSKESP